MVMVGKRMGSVVEVSVCLYFMVMNCVCMKGFLV